MKTRFILVISSLLLLGCSVGNIEYSQKINEKPLMVLDSEMSQCHKEGMIEAVEYFEGEWGEPGEVFEIIEAYQEDDDWLNAGLRTIRVSENLLYPEFTKNKDITGLAYTPSIIESKKFVSRIRLDSRGCWVPELYRHELGHSLSLKHREDFFNLMHSRNRGLCEGNCFLDEGQINQSYNFIHGNYPEFYHPDFILSVMDPDLR